MQLDHIIANIEGLQQEIDGLDEKHAELRGQMRTHKDELAALDGRIMDLRSQAALDDITEEDAIRLTQLKTESARVSSEVQELDRIIVLNRQKRGELRTQQEKYQAELRSARNVAARADIDLLFKQHSEEVAAALARLAVMIRLRDGTPLGTIDSQKLANAVMNRSTGTYHATYEEESARYLDELMARFHLDDKRAA